MVECPLRMRKVPGSNPGSSRIYFYNYFNDSSFNYRALFQIQLFDPFHDSLDNNSRRYFPSVLALSEGKNDIQRHLSYYLQIIALPQLLPTVG